MTPRHELAPSAAAAHPTPQVFHDPAANMIDTTRSALLLGDAVPLLPQPHGIGMDTPRTRPSPSAISAQPTPLATPYCTDTNCGDDHYHDHPGPAGAPRPGLALRGGCPAEPTRRTTVPSRTFMRPPSWLPPSAEGSHDRWTMRCHH